MHAVVDDAQLLGDQQHGDRGTAGNGAQDLRVARIGDARHPHRLLVQRRRHHRVHLAGHCQPRRALHGVYRRPARRRRELAPAVVARYQVAGIEDREQARLKGGLAHQ